MSQGYPRGKDINAGTQDLTTLELVERSIVLVSDRSTWRLLQPNPKDHGEQDSLAALSARLKNIVIVNVPATHDAFHPMAAGLGREFKLLYLCFLLALDVDADKQHIMGEINSIDQLRSIGHAFSVRESIINQSFGSVERSTRTGTTTPGIPRAIYPEQGYENLGTQQRNAYKRRPPATSVTTRQDQPHRQGSLARDQERISWCP